MIRKTTNEESYLKSGRPASIFKSGFSSANLEHLYRSSSLRQRRGGLQCFLVSVVIYEVYILASPEHEMPVRVLTVVFMGINLALLAWAKRQADAKDALWWVAAHSAWQISTAQILVQLFMKNTEVTPRDYLGWVLLLLYLFFATLPLRLPLCTLLAFGTAVTYIVTVVGLSKAPYQTPVDVLVG